MKNRLFFVSLVYKMNENKDNVNINALTRIKRNANIDLYIVSVNVVIPVLWRHNYET